MRLPKGMKVQAAGKTWVGNIPDQLVDKDMKKLIDDASKVAAENEKKKKENIAKQNAVGKHRQKERAAKIRKQKEEVANAKKPPVKEEAKESEPIKK